MDNAKKVFRYIVPFKIKYDDFDTLCETVNNYSDLSKFNFLEDNLPKSGRWIDQISAGSNEYDLYDNVRDSFFQRREGNTWKYEFTGGKIISFKFLLDDNNTINIVLNNLELTICRTGIGFIWYELKLPKNISEEDLLTVQNQLKELNGYTKGCHNLIRKINKNFSKNGFIEPYDTRFPVNENDKNGLNIPFSLGNWLASRLEFLNVEFFAERKNCYFSKINDYFNYSQLSGDTLRDEMMKVTGLPLKVPDKALIFNAMLLPDDMENYMSFIYYISNGYTTKYKISEESSNDYAHPFENVFFYGSAQGAGYYALVNKNNRDTFNTTVSNKINDYFLLYLDVLYQSYSITKFSQELSSSEFSYEYRDYITSGNNLQDRLVSIRARINLFLLKSMTVSVSYVHHQNTFYNHLERILSIEDDVKQLTVGLDALDELHKNQLEKDQKALDRDLQVALSGVALLAIYSAFADSYSFWNDYLDDNPDSLFAWDYIGFVILIVSVSMYIRLFIPFWKSIFKWLNKQRINFINWFDRELKI